MQTKWSCIHNLDNPFRAKISGFVVLFFCQRERMKLEMGNLLLFSRQLLTLSFSLLVPVSVSTSTPRLLVLWHQIFSLSLLSFKRTGAASSGGISFKLNWKRNREQREREKSVLINQPQQQQGEGDEEEEAEALRKQADLDRLREQEWEEDGKLITGMITRMENGFSFARKNKYREMVGWMMMMIEDQTEEEEGWEERYWDHGWFLSCFILSL